MPKEPCAKDFGESGEAGGMASGLGFPEKKVIFWSKNLTEMSYTLYRVVFGDFFLCHNYGFFAPILHPKPHRNVIHTV